MFADLWAKLVSDSYSHLGSTSPCLISDEALNLSARDPFFPRELPSPLLPPPQPRSSSINWVAETAIMKKGKKELQCGKKQKQDPGYPGSLNALPFPALVPWQQLTRAWVP